MLTKVGENMDEKNIMDKSVDEILNDILKDIDTKNESKSTNDNEIDLAEISSVPEDIQHADEETNDEETNEEISDEPTTKTIDEKPKKSKKKKILLIVLTAILIILILFASIAIRFLGDVFGFIGTSENKKVVIKQGYTSTQIASVLKENGIIDSELLFRLYFKLNNPDGVYHYGVFEMNSRNRYDEIIYKLKTPGQQLDTVTLTFPEGYNIDQISSVLEENNVCSKDVFISAMKEIDISQYKFLKGIRKKHLYYSLEGYLYPDTYEFSLPTKNISEVECAKTAIYKMLDRTKQIFGDNNFVSVAKSNGKTIHEVLTLASIVELEASAYPNEMAKVAQVFYNRLAWTDQPAMLGSTPTADYPDNRYDTNQNVGLPPGPLCSVSLNSIKAVLNPDTSVTADYFVTDKNMKFYYTDTLSEHNSLIERLKSEGLWN